jgi:hypothetical protein
MYVTNVTFHVDFSSVCLVNVYSRYEIIDNIKKCRIAQVGEGERAEEDRAICLD